MLRDTAALFAFMFSFAFMWLAFAGVALTVYAAFTAPLAVPVAVAGVSVLSAAAGVWFSNIANRL